jgi:predicted aspartyl protease
MELAGKPHPCLLDSGCEVTLIPKALVEASKNIEVIPSKQRIWAANGSEIEVAGEACVPMWLDRRRIDTFALLSPDIEEIMLGADWLQTHNCLWDFGNGKLYIDGQTAAPLSRKRQLSCRRVYIQEASMLPPKQQVDVVARSTLQSLCPMGAEDWIIESHQLRPGLYVGRTLLPSKHRDLVIRMINTTAESQLLPSGTCLGSLTDGQPVGTRDFELTRNEGSMHDSTQHAYRQHAATNDGTLDTINKTSEVSTDDIAKVLKGKFPEELTAEQQEEVQHRGQQQTRSRLSAIMMTTR